MVSTSLLALAISEDLSPWASQIHKSKYSLSGKETWEDTARRVVKSVVSPVFPAGNYFPTVERIKKRQLLPGGRYLYAAGRKIPAINNCFLFTVEDTKEAWGDLCRRAAVTLMIGGGIGTVYSKIREEGRVVGGLGGRATGPISLMQMINEIGRNVMQGGSRRSAIWAGLHWNHPDIMKFITAKDWPEWMAEAKRNDFSASATLDMTNISVILDDEFFSHYNNGTGGAREVYNAAVEHMLRTGEPGFSVDVGENSGEHLRNACTEITSGDDNDICNLGSINLARIDSIKELEDTTYYAIGMLVAGSIYGAVPFPEVADTRTKNRRLGLGLMGLAEWLAVRGKPYAPDDELGEWLDVWAHVSREASVYWAKKAGVSIPVKTRAIAPTGTISIIGETTGGIEPVFCAAYKRRWLKDGEKWMARYVVDAAAKRLLEQGVDPDAIEDAYTLADDPARRLAFQSFVQERVDHGISSTLNLPPFGNQRFDPQSFGHTLYSYLPRLRGCTVYPDGARGGQPLTRVDLREALEKEDLEFEETGADRACVNGACGI